MRSFKLEALEIFAEAKKPIADQKNNPNIEILNHKKCSYFDKEKKLLANDCANEGIDNEPCTPLIQVLQLWRFA